MAAVNQVWPINTDCKVKLSGLKDDTGAVIDAAEVKGILKNTASGSTVTNATDLTFEGTGVTGEYSVIIPATADIQENQSYTLFITAKKSGKQAVLRMTRPAAFIEV